MSEGGYVLNGPCMTFRGDMLGFTVAVVVRRSGRTAHLSNLIIGCRASLHCAGNTGPSVRRGPKSPGRWAGAEHDARNAHMPMK